MDGSGDLTEELARVVLVQALTLVDVVVELAAGSVLDHQHDPVAILEHCKHNNNNTSQQHVVITSSSRHSNTSSIGKRRILNFMQNTICILKACMK